MHEFGMTPILVADRIEASIKVGYIREYKPEYISPSEKIDRDRYFIEMLAKEYSHLGKTA